MAHKRIMIYAYTRQNFGDDLFVKLLCERYPETSFWIYTDPTYKRTWRTNKNLKVFSNHNVIAKGMNFIGNLLGKMNTYEHILAKRCDACVYIGGSLFIQGPDWESNFCYTKTRQIEGKPFYLLGVNFGPYSEQKFFEKYNEWFATLEDICFREMSSYRLFSHLKNTRCEKDIILSYKPSMSAGEQKKVAVSVIEPARREKLCDFANGYYEGLSRICRYMYRMGYQIHLVSFCSPEGDDDAMKRLTSKLADCAEVTCSTYSDNLDHVIEVFQTSEYIIASRFHAMILGWILGKKVLPVVYSDKMTHVMEDLGYQGMSTTIESLGNFDETKVTEILRAYNYIDMEQTRKEAGKQFAKLDTFLGE